MIAKNEADWIRQCLSSVKDLVNEIILVDTGSTDETVSIAQTFGAKIFIRPWDDDFSAPRNLSLSHASSDWIVVLDADEAFAAEDIQTIREATLGKNTCIEFAQRHYSNDVRLSGYEPVRGEFPNWERSYTGFFESSLCRLFPNHLGIEYRGRVHELVEQSIREKSFLSIKHSPVRIHHYGHTPEVKQKKKKGTLYTPLGAAKLVDNPDDWKGWFELGVEHNNNGLLNESVTAFTESIRQNSSYLSSWVNLGYVLCELGRFAEAETAQKNALKLDGRSEEAYCNLGVVYLRTARFQESEICFRRAVQIVPHYVNAICNLGKALAFQKRFSESVLAYSKALKALPKCIPAKLDLTALYLSVGLLDEAKTHLTEVLSIAPNDERAQALRSQFK